MDTFLGILIWGAIIFFVGKAIIDSIKNRKKETTDRINFLIGRWAQDIYRQEPKQRALTLESMKESLHPLTGYVLGEEWTTEKKNNQKLIQETYELVLEWIEYEEDRKAGKTKITFEILTGSNKDKLFRALITAVNKSEEAMKKFNSLSIKNYHFDSSKDSNDSLIKGVNNRLLLRLKGKKISSQNTQWIGKL